MTYEEALKELKHEIDMLPITQQDINEWYDKFLNRVHTAMGVNNMPRYIHADKMIADTKAMKQVAEGIEIEGIIKYIDEHATANVQEIKHGKWIKTDYYDIFHMPIYECSVCHKKVADHYINCYKYCLHCGAKMDGE